MAELGIPEPAAAAAAAAVSEQEQQQETSGLDMFASTVAVDSTDRSSAQVGRYFLRR